MSGRKPGLTPAPGIRSLTLALALALALALTDINAPATLTLTVHKYKPNTKAELKGAIDQCMESLQSISITNRPDATLDITKVDAGLHKYVAIGVTSPEGVTYHVVRTHNPRPAAAAPILAKLRSSGQSFQVLSSGRIERSLATKTIKIHGPLSMCVACVLCAYVCVCVCVFVCVCLCLWCGSHQTDIWIHSG